MIEKATNVIGRKIISLDEGKEYGKVQDVIYDPNKNKVEALLVDEGGWFSDAKVILINDATIGPDAVTITSKDSIKKASDVSKSVSSISKDDHLKKAKIITEEGKELGQVIDIEFDSSTGIVNDIEITGGLWEKITSGNKKLSTGSIKNIGEKYVVVDSSVQKDFEKQGNEHGLNKVVDKTNEGLNSFVKDVSEGASDLKDKAVDTANKTNDPKFQKDLGKNLDKTKDFVKEKLEQGQNFAEQAFNDAKDGAKALVEENTRTIKGMREEDAAGKYLKVNILDSDDHLLAKKGDLVTHKLLKEAEKEGILEKVLNNVSVHRMPA